MTSNLARLQGLPDAIAAWSNLLKPNQIQMKDRLDERFHACTTGLRQTAPVILKPNNVDELREIVRIAHGYRVPISPISSGRNWGYSSAMPSSAGVVIVDLSAMNKILSFDPHMGTITLEPGVTQAQLAEFLEKENAPYMVPTTGAGPNCSLLSNAFERGYGITPHCDHFNAVQGIEAVMADGTLYQSPLSKWRSDYKWGMGPYIDGIFSQGRVGIVVRATLVLARKPQNMVGFICPFADDARLEDAVHAIREIRASLGGVMGGINLMNARRILSMTEPPPHKGRAISPDEIRSLAKAKGVGDWTITGGVYGTPEIQKAALKSIQRILKNAGIRAIEINTTRSRILLSLAKIIKPVSSSASQWLHVRGEKLDSLLKILEGQPNEVALPLSYWRSGRRPTDDKNFDPARDGCGLIWYSPLVPMQAEVVRRFVTDLEKICLRYEIDPLITLTTITEQLFDSTIPVLFDLNDPRQIENAHKAYRELFAHCAAYGVIPYRVPNVFMDLLKDLPEGWRQANNSIVQAMDPHGILSPGRYDPR